MISKSEPELRKWESFLVQPLEKLKSVFDEVYDQLSDEDAQNVFLFNNHWTIL